MAPKVMKAQAPTPAPTPAPAPVVETPKKTNSKKQNVMFGFVTDFLISNNAPNSLVTEWSSSEKSFSKIQKVQEKKTNNKKLKDPNAPKKPTSAYIYFCNDKRPVVKKQNPDMKVTEIVSKLGKEWKSISKKESAAYHTKAEKDKQRYMKEMESYVPPAGLVQKKESKVRHRSGYQIFCDEERPKVKKQHPDMKGKEVLSLLGQKWSSLTDKQKTKYKDMAQTEKESVSESL